MPQLPVLPAASQLSGANAGQAAISTFSADGGSGVEDLQGPSFGAVLTKQLKGISALLERSEDSGFSGILAGSGESDKGSKGGNGVDNAAAAVFPVDFSALTVSALLPSAVSQPGSGAATVTLPLPAEAEMAKPAVDLPQTGDWRIMHRPSAAATAEQTLALPWVDDTRLAAEIAGGGRILPQMSLPDRVLAHKPAGSVNGAGDKVGARLPDLPVALSPGQHIDSLAGEPALQLTDMPVAVVPHPLAGMADAIVRQSEPADLPVAISPKQHTASLAGESAVQLADMPVAGVPHPLAGMVDAIVRQPEPIAALPVVVPRVGSVEWGGAVGEKILWMANQNHQVAELHLNPPNLGPLEVRLTVSNDQVSALFVSHHSAVREAIETAMPRLREMMADNGIMLGNTMVSAESFSQQQSFGQRGGRWAGHGIHETDGGTGQMSSTPLPGILGRDGMVDIFA